MKLMFCLSLIGFSTFALAQAPVEDRTVQQKPQTQSQFKADYARREKERAADRTHHAESELNEAKRSQQEAEKRLQEARSRVGDAAKSLEQAKRDYLQAESRAEQTEAELGQAWKK